MIAMGGADRVNVDQQDVPAEQEHLSDQAPGNTMADVEALRGCAPLMRVVSPKMDVDDLIVTHGDKTLMVWDAAGVWPAALDVYLYSVEYGRFFTDLDEENANPVCVIGTGIRDELFGSPEETGHDIIPLGEIINLNGQPFTIVGMFTHYESERDKKEREEAKKHPQEAQAGPARRKGWGRHGNWAFERKNLTLYMPLNTAWVRFRAAGDASGIPDNRLSDIGLKVTSLDQLDPALQQTRNILMLTHHGIEDFSFRTQENQLEAINKQIHNARMSGGVIAAISLLVGGIGIMNIMLVSVTERTREIGIRMAVGARARDILLQFLIEAVALSSTGGIVGILCGIGGAKLITVIKEWPTLVSTNSIVIAFAFSAAVGVFFGFYPARKASQLDPIDALRYE